jgi:hypothetical protein
MPYYQSTYHSKLYRDFKEIEHTDYRGVVRFYEEHESQIRQLDEQEHFDLLVAYVNSLFEIGAYQRHLLIADAVIELTVERNIQSYQGTDLFYTTLFKKAASLYNIMEYARAEYILCELVRIDPKDEQTILFLKKCRRRKSPGITQHTRAAGIFLFLLTALIISIEVLFIRPFYDMHTALVERTRFSTFGLGCFLLVAGDLIHRWQIERGVNQFVRKVKASRKQSGDRNY